MTAVRISALDRPVNYRARLIAPAALATALLTGALRLAVRAQENADARELLAEAAGTMTALDSFTFSLTTLNGATTFVEGISLKSVVGAVKRPDRFIATAEVDLMLATVKITILGAEGRLWFTNPFGDGESFEELRFGRLDELDPSILINPDRLILPALETLSEAVVAGEEELEDGTRATRVDGLVDLGRAADLAATPEASDLSDLIDLPEELPFSVWIDADRRVRRIEITGAILPLESSRLVRRIDFSAFDEPVDIEPPV